MKFLKTASIFAYLCLALAAVGAQDTGEWYLDKPIREIRFEGLKTVARSELDGITKEYIGKAFTNNLFRELQSRLYSLDYFDGVIAPEAQKLDGSEDVVIIVFKVTEKPMIQDIVFSGNKRIRSSDLLAAIVLKPQMMINSNKLKVDERALRDYYLERGYLEIQVSSSVQEDKEKNTLTILFTIDEGIQTAVKTISFTGNSFASASALKGIMETKEQGLFDNGLFKEAKLAKDIQSIQLYYWDRGYIDAKVLSVDRRIELDPQSEKKVLTLNFNVQEGQQFLFGGFTFQGNLIFKTEDLMDLVRQPIGKTLSKQKLDNDFQRVLDLYYENGYIFNTISKIENRQENLIAYTINIVERPRAHIENIIIKGNTKTKDSVILREIPLEVGDVFSKTKIIDGIKNLYNLQFFSVVQPETPQGNADQLMDLVINVEEAQTAELVFGLAFSGATDFPVSGQIKWQDRNFFGNGQTFGLEMSVSPVNQSLSVNFTENWLFDQRMTVGGTISLGHYVRSNIDQDISYPTYTSDTGIPDPYNLNTYVFTQATSYNGINYSAGQLFPGVPTASEISTYNLITEYQYDINNGTLRSSGNTMKYDSYEMSAGANTGYTFHTFLGRFGLATGLSSTVQLVTYDDTIYRPASKSLRNNLNRIQFENTMRFKANWDTRDYIFNPTLGSFFGGTYTLTGGILSGETHFTRLDARVEGYLKLLDLPVVEGYNFKLVLKAKSAFSQLFNPIGNQGLQVLQPKDELYIDGMLNGRGWDPQRSGRLTWANAMELKFPIFESILWWETFLDSSILIDTSSTSTWLTDLAIGRYKFSWGTGFRITNPQFPIGLYAAKPFTWDANGIKWEKGQGLFGTDLDMRLVLSFGIELN